MRLRLSRRELWVAGAALLVALAALASLWSDRLAANAAEREWVAAARRGYRSLWQDLWRDAAAAARAVGQPSNDAQARLAAFRRLAEIHDAHGRRTGGESGRWALLLLDPDGVAAAWAGEGLLHELRPEDVPRAGPYFAAGFSAVTLFAVEPLGDSRRPWRVIAGASFRTHLLPFGRGEAARWSLVREPGEAAPGALAVTLPNAPILVVARGGSAASGGWGGRPWQERLAWGALAFALLALAAMRGAAPAGERAAVAPLVLAGLLAGGGAASVPAPALAALAAGLALAGLGTRGRRMWGGPPAAAQGAAAVLLLAAAAWGYQLLRGPLDLASGLLAPPEVVAVRLAFGAAAFGLLALAGRPPRGREAPPRQDRWGWLAVALLLAGSALTDVPAAALVLLAGAGGAAAAWAERRFPSRGMTLAALALMAALAAGGAGEAAYRLRLQGFVGEELLPRLAPPSRRELAALRGELEAHFASRDLAGLVPRTPEGLERQDLAFALWRGSPLARRSSLSALVIERLAGPVSTFSFGMPLTPRGDPDWSPGRLEGLRLPLWQDALISGRAVLAHAGAPWAVARYWLLPRPGFETADRRRLEEVEVGLLKGGPAAGPLEGLPAPVVYALYDPDGRAALSPWDEAPPLAAELRAGGGARGAVVVGTPAGRARAWARRAAAGWEVVYLPFQTPLGALERVATVALSVLLVLAAATLAALLLALPREALSDLLRRTVRSYSKRLLLVYTALLLLPLLLLNFVLVRAIEQRVERQQRAAGEAALGSAQKVLGDLILGLDPGFGIDTALNDTLFASLSQVVRHELNLYWGSSVYVSSRHELFTAGLLPQRIPGEIYARLALLGYHLAPRNNRVGETRYLELYAPLRVPGVPLGEERLFLSMPLLAQQEETARELAHLRRQALLVTAGLFVLLTAVGTRLADNFTRPLQQLVLGTRRIAAGAPSLDLAPTELELAALVEAVDQMARRIAEGRERLVREKQVVERMVESITSGVVSVDRDRRVLMHNRVAADLLGVRTGERLDEAVAGAPRLHAVAAFLRQVGGEVARETVRLGGPGVAEGDGGEREWTLVWVPVPGEGEPAALLVVEDATEVLRGQRLLAWAEMARIIAHEIKNPLTPIRLSAEHMREVYASDPAHFEGVFERCTVNILTQVDELRSIASEFSTYSAILSIDRKPGDLVESIGELVEGYRAAPPEGVSVELEAEGPIPARFDAKLLSRAVRNLLENALRASAGGGRVVVRLEQRDGQARISVLDSGPGVKPELLPRIFDPYFSTHDTGTGLGLPIARRVAEEHGGGITARNRPEGGLEVVITLPVG